MTKNQKIKFIFKWIGIGAAVAVGIIGLVCAYIGISGGFRKKVVEPTEINFSLDQNGYQTDTPTYNPVYIIDGDEFFVINPTPADSTELDATLKIASGKELVKDILVYSAEKPADSKDDVESQADEQEPKDEVDHYVPAEKVKLDTYKIKLGEKFKLALSEEVLTNPKRTIEFYVEHELTTCKARVFVDTNLESFKLKYEKINPAPNSENNFFPGDSLYASIDLTSITPVTAISQSVLTNLTNKFKYTQFSIDNNDIATIESIEYDTNKIPKAKIKILKDGLFTVTAQICNSYLNEQKIITNEQYNSLTIEERKAYDLMLYGGINEEGTEVVGFMISDQIQILSRAIEIENITATTNIINARLFSTTRYNAEGLMLSVNPQNIAGTHYTPNDLKYLLDDVEILGGYFVGTKADSDLSIIQADNTLKYIKKSDRYITVNKEVGLDNHAVWAITINDYYSNIEPSNCLVVSLTYTITSLDDSNNVVTENETIYTYIPLTITREEIPNFKIKLDNENSPSINLAYDDIYNLDNAKLVLVDSGDNILTPETTLAQSASPYKTTLFVTKTTVRDENGTHEKYDVKNDEFEIGNTLLGATSNYIRPLSSGTGYLYAIVVKTNKDGKVVDNDNAVIENVEEILANCVVLHESSSVMVNVHQQLEIYPTNVITLYYQGAEGLTEITEDDPNYEIGKNSYGEIGTLKLYNRSKIYIKLNVNDMAALKKAYDNNNLTFETDNSIIYLESLEIATIQGEEVYLLPVTAIDVNKENPVANLIIKQDNSVKYTLEIETLDYILKSLNLTPNTSVDEQNQAIVYLSLNGQSGEYFWTVDTGISQNKPLEVTVNKTPSQATIIGEIKYQIYKLTDESFDLSTLDTLDADIINNHFTLDSSVLQIMDGYPLLDKNQNDLLKFNIIRAGKAILIASYTRVEDSVTIYSKPLVINAVYPYFEEQAYNYGNTGYYETYEGENYRKLVTSYNAQKTNLLNFTEAEVNGEEKAEGKKIGLDWKYSNSAEVTATQLFTGLYKFEIESVKGSQTVTKDDFSFIQQDVNGQKINYLVTPRVDKKVYIKIKVSTPFGYTFANTYNYVLIPDFTVITESTDIEMTSNDTINLFKLKYNPDTKDIENNGGKFFITNNFDSTNYTLNNDKQVTGFDGKKIKVIYLPVGYELSLIEDLDLKKLLNIAENIDQYQVGDNIFEFRRTICIAPQDELALLTVNNENGTLKIGNVEKDIQIKVTLISIMGDNTEIITVFNVLGKKV